MDREIDRDESNLLADEAPNMTENSFRIGHLLGVFSESHMHL